MDDVELFGAFEEAVSEPELNKKRDYKISAENDTVAFKKAKAVASTSKTDTPLVSVVVTEQKTETGLTKFSAVPKNYDGAGSVPEGEKKGPAKVYPFKLDPFQQEAVNYIEKGESVLVAAHTSAGKTAVAEYAIAKSMRDKQRVIYTSPIKALSNQKYRDMQEEFSDVGLMTGDMTINPNATCLIMTTEILRSMLYRGSEVMREVAWVVYDEVHYMRDKERGVVWEESIVLLPHKVRFVFLSATIPNAKEFVGWVAHIHHQPCHVVYTEYRPVPLQHFLFPSGADGLYLVVDEKGRFREENFQRAISTLKADDELETSSKKRKKKVVGKGDASDLFRIVKLVMEKELDPCIVFSFSKKDCETYALQMAKLDFNNDEERGVLETVFNSALEALPEEDRALPQVEAILPLLKRGVGIHHGGLLPTLKEVVEILFQEGYIKCLFATETFSIGINMPARTVIFTNTRKFDGLDFRWISSGEYIQMSGRAGRRGKDDKGIVIQMLDEKMEPDVAKDMLYGDSDPLHSSYHVSYNMVVNMLRVEDSNPENLLRASFHQYQQERKTPMLEEKAKEAHEQALGITVAEEADVSAYHAWCRQLERAENEMLQLQRRAKHCLPFLQQGRLLLIRDEPSQADWGWGVLLAAKKPQPVTSSSSKSVVTAEAIVDSALPDLVLHVLVPAVDAPVTSGGGGSGKSSAAALVPVPRPGGDASSSKVGGDSKTNSNGDSDNRGKNDVKMTVVEVSIMSVFSFSAIRLTLPKDLQKESTRRKIWQTLKEVMRRFPAGQTNDVFERVGFGSKANIPLLEPDADMGIETAEMKMLLQSSSETNRNIRAAAFHSAKDRLERVRAYDQRVALLEKARLLRQEAKDSQAIALRDELRRMKRVLRKLGYIASDGVLGLKGRFSCELNTADELVVTDMVFEGVFNSLSPELCVALLSCFVHQDSKEPDMKLRSDFQAPYKALQEVARNVAKAKIDSNVPCDEEEYIKSFNPGMMEVSFAWASGSKFIDLCQLTDLFEGHLIRVFRRLEELLRQIASAAASVGNIELKVKFEDGAKKIRRGVVFAPPLYI
jgi:ATP-dependent RNA helicase DOB1